MFSFILLKYLHMDRFFRFLLYKMLKAMGGFREKA